MLSLMTSAVEAGTRGKIRADNVKYYKEQGYFVFSGNAQTIYKDYVITSDSVQYYEKDDRAIFTGNVTATQGLNRITGQTMNANMKTDEFVIDGNVYIYYVRKAKDGTAKPADKLTKKDIVEMQADHVVYQSDEKTDKDHLTATKVNNQIVLRTDEDVIKCDYLEYKGGDEVAIARNNVEVTRKAEDKLNCNEFTYRLEGADEGFDAIGGVNLEFTIDDEENDSTTQATPATGTPTQPNQPNDQQPQPKKETSQAPQPGKTAQVASKTTQQAGTTSQTGKTTTSSGKTTTQSGKTTQQPEPKKPGK